MTISANITMSCTAIMQQRATAWRKYGHAQNDKLFWGAGERRRADCGAARFPDITTALTLNHMISADSIHCGNTKSRENALKYKKYHWKRHAARSGGTFDYFRRSNCMQSTRRGVEKEGKRIIWISLVTYQTSLSVYKSRSISTSALKALLNRHKNNLQIILVDDGSPDNCPAMLTNGRKKGTFNT